MSSIKTMTQNAKILEYIEQHGSITSKEAMMELDIYRLASRVCDLRKLGYPIESVTETNSRTGKRYSRYYLEGVTV